MRDKRRKAPGISLSAAGRHTRLAPGHAGAGKAGGYVADGLAVHAHAGLGLGAAAARQLTALFDHDYFLLASAAEHFQRREDAAGTRTDNYNISVHIYLQT